MKKELTYRLRRSFEDFANESDDVEFWFARDLQRLLDYSEWRNFSNAIEKARIACDNSGQIVSDHFVDVNKKVKIGSEAEREIDDLMLTRYACYLIAQNGDPRKEQIILKKKWTKIIIRGILDESFQ